MRKIIGPEAGQTAVEYLLLIAVAVGIGLTFFKKMDQYLIKNPNGLISKPLNSFKKSIGTPAERYKRFPLRKP